jgi:hypothetical protein
VLSRRAFDLLAQRALPAGMPASFCFSRSTFSPSFLMKSSI